MNILFVHQNFPGQYIHIVRSLCKDSSHKVVALGLKEKPPNLPSSLIYCRYKLLRGAGNGTHPLASETEAKVIRGESCAHAASILKSKGFTPDIICAHPGWGESLFLTDIWPGVPILSYHEFYYHPTGLDTDFDPEFPSHASWAELARVRMKNAHLNLSLESSSWNVSPTFFQRSTFPNSYQSRISVIHDGIDVNRSKADLNPPPVQLPNGITIDSNQQNYFCQSYIEPYRGCHTFIRSLPHIQRDNPNAIIVIVGSSSGVSYGSPCPEGEWCNYFFNEIEGSYDPNRIHLVGSISHDAFTSLLKLSSCHVYLTYPFVLSWSLLEAMSCCCPIVGSATAPVKEVISDGLNGVLVDFFSPHELASAVTDILTNPASASLGAAARQTVLDRYSLDKCLPRQLQLLNLVATKSLVSDLSF